MIDFSPCCTAVICPQHAREYKCPISHISPSVVQMCKPDFLTAGHLVSEIQTLIEEEYSEC